MRKNLLISSIFVFMLLMNMRFMNHGLEIDAEPLSNETIDIVEPKTENLVPITENFIPLAANMDPLTSAEIDKPFDDLFETNKFIELTESSDILPEPELIFSRNIDQVRQLEAEQELMQVVALEYDGTFEGALAVATVVMNRLEDGRWGDTIHEVLSAPDQFSTFKSIGRASVNRVVANACAIVQVHGYRYFPAYVMWFCTNEHYKESVFFKGLQVFERSHKTVWCYDN